MDLLSNILPLSHNQGLVVALLLSDLLVDANLCEVDEQTHAFFREGDISPGDSGDGDENNHEELHFDSTLVLELDCGGFPALRRPFIVDTLLRQDGSLHRNADSTFFKDGPTPALLH